MSIRMRHTSSHTKNRRSHHVLVGIKTVVNKETGTRSLPHRLDESTGMYRGKQIVTVKVEKSKHVKGKGPRTEAAHEHTHEKHDHKHANASKKQSRGFFGKIGNALPKARSGAGGGGAEK